jgi:bifunctional DNA-binding transcriptional regulator/antitoxin component of YhaV-PrlF toxin-antitoxin module
MKISERGQITIPRPLRDKYGFNKNVEVDLMPIKGGVLICKHAARNHPVDQVFGILKKFSDTNSYIEEIRGR